MDAFFTSTLAVALAEIGDKTQLLSLLLITRFRQPTPIILAILIATIANHALAGLLGAAVGSWLGPELLRWIVGLGFLAMAAWTLIPDTLDEDQKAPTRGAFIASLIAFFLAEMGDKTQLATIGLAAAHPGHTAQVIAGTTLGMMLANVPVVLLGERIAERVKMSSVRFVAAALFAVFGAVVLWRGVG